MEILLGNAHPKLPEGEELDAPAVIQVIIPEFDDIDLVDGFHGYRQVGDSGLTGEDLRRHLADAVLNNDGVTSLPGHEPVMAVVHPAGIWRTHAKKDTVPTFVSCPDSPETERILAEYFECPRGLPDDVEETHFTRFGPPGVGPDEMIAPGADFDLEANITTDGRDIQAQAFGGPLGVAGTGTTAPTGTTITLDDQTAPGSTTKWTGMRIIRGTVFANIISNTNATPPVLTVDRWYNTATPGGSAGATPAAGTYVILGGPPQSWFIGLSANTTTLANPSTNTSLPGEITSAGGGLIRQIAPWAHTAGTNITTLTPVFTANGSDALPVTIGSMGTFNSMVVGDTTKTMFFNSLVSPTATLSSTGDQLTLTQTITGT